jgi:putative nucleotidyltransferase with HDIG domain
VAPAPTKPGRNVRKTDPGYGLGTHDIDANPFELANPEELQQTLLTIFRSPTYRPPVLPNVAIELTELTRKTTASYDEVASALQKDPLIVAGVLKVAQSPLYGGRLPVQSLKEAIQRLGINTLRDIVWQVVAGMRLFRVKGYTAFMERLQAHSVFTANLARLVASRAGVAAEHAFLCGLLHDVGISGTLIALSESATKAPAIDLLLGAIDGIHEQAGGQMAKLWGLSPEIVAVIERHHDAGDPSKLSALIAILGVTERLASEHGFGIAALGGVQLLDRQPEGRYEQSLARLRLTGKEAELRKTAGELAERWV